ncbi:facilitated trehalose transporter Tret1-like [Ostrinia nubilalis]|uniref:facilitated trehalose transporter Tret1-like n=1 Tax=Ostrinia nubilalis TaxID=29057 RepID=UPI0030825925
MVSPTWYVGLTKSEGQDIPTKKTPVLPHSRRRPYAIGPLAITKKRKQKAIIALLLLNIESMRSCTRHRHRAVAAPLHCSYAQREARCRAAVAPLSKLCFDGAVAAWRLYSCFLTSGVSLNFLTHGMVVGFSSVLLPQLRETTDIDEASATWIASIFGLSLIVGALLVSVLMNSYGRKPVNISSSAFMTVGCLIISASDSAPSLLFARCLQGFSMGLLANMGNVLIGECCSPKNRAALLTTISFAIMFGVFLVHCSGTIVSWQRVALIAAFIAVADFISPESPSFYAIKGKYDDCRKAFHWLRGLSDEEELEKLIKINMTRRSIEAISSHETLLDKVKKNITYIKTTFRKREVYKPILL